jgi:hypothetical protein
MIKIQTSLTVLPIPLKSQCKEEEITGVIEVVIEVDIGVTTIEVDIGVTTIEVDIEVTTIEVITILNVEEVTMIGAEEGQEMTIFSPGKITIRSTHQSQIIMIRVLMKAKNSVINLKTRMILTFTRLKMIGDPRKMSLFLTNLRETLIINLEAEEEVEEKEASKEINLGKLSLTDQTRQEEVQAEALEEWVKIREMKKLLEKFLVKTSNLATKTSLVLRKERKREGVKRRVRECLEKTKSKATDFLSSTTRMTRMTMIFTIRKRRLLTTNKVAETG